MSDDDDLVHWLRKLNTKLGDESADEITRLRAELDAARADAERYRWLRDVSLGHNAVADPDNQVQVFVGTAPARTFYGWTLDAAIDAARSGGEG